MTQIPQGLPLKSLCTFNQVESQGVGRREGLEVKGLHFSWKIRPSAVHRWCLLLYCHLCQDTRPFAVAVPIVCSHAHCSFSPTVTCR